MRVTTTTQGYDGVCVRQPGEEFDMPDGSKGTWFKPVERNKQEQGGKDRKEVKDLV